MLGLEHLGVGSRVGVHVVHTDEERVMTVGPIEEFMVADHVRLDELLQAAMEGDAIGTAAFEEFRERLLRHIGMEEKILIPLLRDRGAPGHNADELRSDHGQIAKLLVPTPTLARCDELCAVLTRHNTLEEGEGGLYEACDAIAKLDGPHIVERLRAAPRVPLAVRYDGPLIRR